MFNTKKFLKISLSKIIYVIFLSVIGGTVGGILFIRFIVSPFAVKDEIQVSISNERRVTTTEKPIILENDLPSANPDMESFGDKLAQAGWHLRQRRSELALKDLKEAQNETAHHADDDSNEYQIMWRDMDNRVSRVENDLQLGNANQAANSIDDMIHELDNNHQ